MTLSRISITIPREVLKAADRQAEELDRSRSWVVVEALRTYLAGTGQKDDRRTTPSAVTESSAPPPARPPFETASVPGLGASRQAQLQADLHLTPTERVLGAERTARLDQVRGRVVAADRILSFNRYEDYLDWRRRDDLVWR